MATRAIPTDGEFLRNAEFRTEPSLTFNVNFATGRVEEGYIDDIEAMRQAVILILFTEKRRWIIHEPDYGVNLRDLMGESMMYVIPMIESRVRTAVLADDRITGAYNFSFKKNFNPEQDPEKPELHRSTLTCTFDCETIYGTVKDIEVDVNV